MTSEQLKHLKEIRLSFADAVTRKYAEGVASHGGNLWERSNIFLLDQAMEETVDQYVYLFTLREDMVKKAYNFEYVSLDDGMVPEPPRPVLHHAIPITHVIRREDWDTLPKEMLLPHGETFPPFYIDCTTFEDNACGLKRGIKGVYDGTS